MAGHPFDMDPIEKNEKKRQAQRRLADQRRRAGLLRGRVIAISLVCFGLLWAVVFVQMATGNDPVLGDGSGSKATKTASAATPAKEDEGTVEPEPTETETEAESLEAESFEPEPEFEAEPEVQAEPEAEPEPLTTGQS
jgi:cytoskeletal protein RodZ